METLSAEDVHEIHEIVVESDPATESGIRDPG